MDQFDSEDESRGRPGVPVDTGRLLQALRRHWRVIPTAVAAGALIGLAVAMLLIKPTYTAKTTILWEPPSTAEPSDRSFLTQVDSIKLTSNMQEVKRRLRSKASVEELKEKINLLFDGQSHLVVIEATDGSAKGAVLFANTVADVFLAYQRSIGSDRGSEHVKRFDADIDAATKQLQSAREAYDKFREELGVLSDFDTELKLWVGKVAEFKQQMVLSSTESQTEAARQVKLAQEAAKQSPTTVSATMLTDPNATRLAELRGQLASERAHLSSDHPTVLRLQQQVEALESKVRSGSDGMVKGAVNLAANPQYDSIRAQLSASKVQQEAAAARQENYSKLLTEAELRLAKLSAAQGRAQQLLAAISSQEAHKAQLETMRVQNLDQARSAAADFRVVNKAGTPDKPNASKRRAMVIRMPLIALALAVFGIIAYELRGLRVHTAREAGFWANAAVIASSTWPREQTTLGALIDELSDAAPAVRGTTLVVGARVNEVPLAREIAYWLSHLTTGMTQRSVVGADEPVVGPGALGAGPSLRPGGSASEIPAGGGSALARRGNDAITVAQAWDGPPHGPSLRRASRLADRVLVVVAAGTMSVTEVAQLRSRLGRSSGIGVLLVGLNPDFVKLPDRVGEVDRFWEERAA